MTVMGGAGCAVVASVRPELVAGRTDAGRQTGLVVAGEIGGPTRRSSCDQLRMNGYLRCREVLPHSVIRSPLPLSFRHIPQSETLMRLGVALGRGVDSRFRGNDEWVGRQGWAVCGWGGRQGWAAIGRGRPTRAPAFGVARGVVVGAALHTAPVALVQHQVALTLGAASQQEPVHFPSGSRRSAPRIFPGIASAGALNSR